MALSAAYIQDEIIPAMVNAERLLIVSMAAMAKEIMEIQKLTATGAVEDVGQIVNGAHDALTDGLYAVTKVLGKHNFDSPLLSWSAFKREVGKLIYEEVA